MTQNCVSQSKARKPDTIFIFHFGDWVYLIPEPESSHGSWATLGDETDKNSFVDRFDPKANLVLSIFAKNHLKGSKSTN